VLYVNPAWEHVFGRSLAELQRNPGLWLETIHPDDRELAKGSLAMLLADGHLDLEYRIVRPDGSIRWIADHAQLIRDAEGKPQRIDGVGRDVTRRKEATERQNALMHDLQAANEELKNFAYVVSHDLKAPLRAIGSLAEWIATDNADKFDNESREHLRLLIGRVHRMDALIDGILQYSRIGRLHEGLTDVDLDRLVREVVDSLAPPAHIRVEIDTPLLMLHAEQTRIQQVFQNLVSNAIKYMDKPQGEVHIGCLDERSQWKFYVRDTGPGIEQRHFERIFQLFQTLAPRDRVESTGVGLTVVKKIIDLHGGKVWLESEVGAGSTFFFTLPKRSTRAPGKPARAKQEKTQ
jgi:PAS domain S-box-containing protein